MSLLSSVAPFATPATAPFRTGPFALLRLAFAPCNVTEGCGVSMGLGMFFAVQDDSCVMFRDAGFRITSAQEMWDNARVFIDVWGSQKETETQLECSVTQ